MIAQQAVLASATARRARSANQGRVASSRACTTSRSRSQRTAAAEMGLPTAVADRIASLFVDDPGLAVAVNAQLPAARQASARDLAAYGQARIRQAPLQILDTTG